MIPPEETLPLLGVVLGRYPTARGQIPVSSLLDSDLDRQQASQQIVESH